MNLTYLNKKEKAQLLPELFGLLYENMHSVAPSGLSCEEERAQYLAAVSPALEKEARQIILCHVDGELAGFLQFYIRQEMLMVEELQLKRKFQATTAFFQFSRELAALLPKELETIEAYADKRNLYSIRLMQRLGMAICEEEQESPFVHLRGDIKRVRARFC